MATQLGGRQHTQHEMQPSFATKHPYRNFAIMVLTSTLVMFAASYTGLYQSDHIYFSQTQAYMTLIMGASMAVIMLIFMRHMLLDRRSNWAAVGISALVFFISFFLLQSQKTIDDVAFMEAMIPHHSMAILSSSRARISDPRVQDLAGRIIKSQTQEIAEMKALIKSLKTKS